jgi:predicted nuclease of restriction endonuclease-like (RecB) superfamily
MSELTLYSGLLSEIKDQIRNAQGRAAQAINSELIQLYWRIGQMIDARQQQQGWGSAVIPRLAIDLHNEMPEQKGFSERNIKRMLAFYRAYPNPASLPMPDVPQAVAQTDSPAKVPQAVALSMPASPLWQVGWGQHALLLEKIKDQATRLWYIQQTALHGWGRDRLSAMIRVQAHARHGAAVSNFDQRLSTPYADVAQRTLKDPYIFDFLTLGDTFHERELETGLVRHLEKFLLELGAGFAFVGRQYRIAVADEDFYIDLLFYHLKLRSYVVVELKRGEFKPEYAGKLNFYCNLVDDQLRHESDAPTIGLMLCQSKNRVLAEYALRGIDKPIGVADYELTRALPESLQSTLPTIEDIEAELQGASDDE